jgi:energy-coupling factor transporter transmembrane protein EcfT
MKINDIDYYASCSDSFLHRINAKYKLASVFVVLLLALNAKSPQIPGLLYIIMLTVTTLSNIKKKEIILASFYPLVFLVIFLFSVDNITIAFFSTIVLKVLSVSFSIALLIFTTSYAQIFKVISKFLPEFLTDTLFLTYRSIFILFTVIENIKTTLFLRSDLSLKKPLFSIKVLGSAIGFLVIKSIDSSEKMYENLKLRGYFE